MSIYLGDEFRVSLTEAGGIFAVLFLEAIGSEWGYCRTASVLMALFWNGLGRWFTPQDQVPGQRGEYENKGAIVEYTMPLSLEGSLSPFLLSSSKPILFPASSKHRPAARSETTT